MVEDDLLDDSKPAFAKRLHDALEYLGYSTLAGKVRFVAQTTGRTESTITHWLTAKRKPRNAEDMVELADALQVPWAWLMFGGYDVNMARFRASLETMSDWERGKVRRFLIRLLNNDPKTIRLAAMVEHGQMSRSQFLRLM